MLRNILGTTLLFLGVLVVVLSGLFSALGMWQSFSPNSKLNYFETRIESVEEEFMRRSPELRANFHRFRECEKRVGCSLVPIFQERNALLRQYWPELLGRLTVADDWGEAHLTAQHHQDFQQELQQAGGVERAARCFPQIHYYHLNSGEYIYIFKGLRCLEPLSPRREG